jgi:hypothetical protein
MAKIKPHHWTKGAAEVGAVVAQAKAGDTVAPKGRPRDWRLLHGRLMGRGLLVLPVGGRLFVVPWDDTLARLIEATGDGDATAAAIMRDRARDLLHGDLAAAVNAIYSRRPTDRKVPGIEPANPRAAQREAETLARRAVWDARTAAEKRMRKGLSSLQRALLLALSDNHRGVDLAVLRPPTSRAAAAARSRALRRLEQRGLIVVTRQGGRAARARLTHTGHQFVYESC